MTLEQFAGGYSPEPNSGCWLWKFGGCGGYGQASWKGEVTYAHRISWEIHVGTIPRGLQVLHKCDVRCCVNPGHLFLGTMADNMADKIKKGRQTKGEFNNHSKLTPATVRLIRRRRSSGSTLQSLADNYGITKSSVWEICNGHTWKHLV